MKHLRILILIPLTLLLTGSVTQQHLMVVARKNVAAGGGSPTTEFTDNFNRANSDSLGANWTEVVGDLDIASNILVLQTASYGAQAAITTSAGLSADGWAKVQLPTFSAGSTFAKVLFRVTNGSTECYGLNLNTSGQVGWSHYATPGGSETGIASNVALGTIGGNYVGFTWSGSGDNVTVRVWLNPTGDIPISASEWGASETADVTFTDNPGANNVDSGGQVGFAGAQGAALQIQFDNLLCGNL